MTSTAGTSQYSKQLARLRAAAEVSLDLLTAFAHVTPSLLCYRCSTSSESGCGAMSYLLNVVEQS